MPTDKQALTFRLEPEVVLLIRKLSDEHSLAQAAVVGLAVRELARRGVAPLAGPYPEPAALPKDAPRPRKRKEK